MRGKKQKEPAGMNPGEIFAALELLEKERGIPQTFMMEKIIQAITTAYKRDHEGVENVIVVPLVRGGDGLDNLIHHKGLGDPTLLFQQLQRGKDLRGVHPGGFLLLLASHGVTLLYIRSIYSLLIS